MHELSVFGALIDQVSALATARGAVRVTRITIAVGPLSGIDPGLLHAAFRVLRAGSCAASADLAIDTLAVRIGCDTCGAEMATAPNRLACVLCGGLRTRITQGDELQLRRVELALETPPAPRAKSAPDPRALLHAGGHRREDVHV